MRDWCDVTKEFMEEIFQECLGVYVEYSSVRGSSYMKVIGLIKKEWLTLLDKLDELSGVDSHVLAFAKKVQENLKTLDEAE